MWCISEIDTVFRERMYDLLDLYEEPYDPLRPSVGFDEKPKQLLEDSRCPVPMEPGHAAKHDYEYVRRGTANIFMAVEFKAGKRTTRVTSRRTKRDFAKFVKHLVDKVYPNAEGLRIILHLICIIHDIPSDQPFRDLSLSGPFHGEILSKILIEDLALIIITVRFQETSLLPPLHSVSTYPKALRELLSGQEPLLSQVLIRPGDAIPTPKPMNTLA